MALRFYINGTAGGKDGTEVTAANPIIADGLFPSGSTPATKKVQVFIRADEGEIYNNVMYGVIVDDFAKMQIEILAEPIQQISPPSNWVCNLIKSVGDTNVSINLLFKAKSSEQEGIDTSVKLYACPIDFSL